MSMTAGRAPSLLGGFLLPCWRIWFSFAARSGKFVGTPSSGGCWPELLGWVSAANGNVVGKRVHMYGDTGLASFDRVGKQLTTRSGCPAAALNNSRGGFRKMLAASLCGSGDIPVDVSAFKVQLKIAELEVDGMRPEFPDMVYTAIMWFQAPFYQ